MKSVLLHILPLALLAMPALVQAQTQDPYAHPTPASAGVATPAAHESTPGTAPQQPALLANATIESVEPSIGVGDLLKISVMGAPDYDQEIRVGATGDVSLALVGAIHVGGLTTDQASEVIRQHLMDGGFFSDPQVTVFEKEYATQGVSVLGEVQRPGVYPIVGPRHLFDVLSVAGGLSPRAGQLVSITHRTQPKKPETVHLSNDPEKNVQANVQIFPGDTIVVSRAGIVYVVGDVRRPTGVVMDNSGTITALQAIAMAEGANSTAALNKSKIIRKTPQGQQEIPIELKKILAAKKSDVTLQAGDILFIPSSAAKSAAARSLDAAVRLATSVVAYRAVY